MKVIILVLILLAFLAGFYIYTTQRLDVHLNVIAPPPSATSQTNNVVSQVKHTTTMAVPAASPSPVYSKNNAPTTNSPVSQKGNLVPVASPTTIFSGTTPVASTSPVSVASSTFATGSSPSVFATASAPSPATIKFVPPPIDAGVVATGSGINEVTGPTATTYSTLTPTVAGASPAPAPAVSSTTVSTLTPTTSAIAGTIENLQNIDEKTAKCPNILVKSGDHLLLYNTTDTHDEMPVMFKNLEEYVNYINAQRAKGIYCPILEVQPDNTSQGQDVFRIKSTPFNDYYNEPFSGASTYTSDNKPGLTIDQVPQRNAPTFPFFNIEGFDGGIGGSPAPASIPESSPTSVPASASAPATIPEQVPSLPPSNTPPQNENIQGRSPNFYNGFDPYGYDVGKYRKLDKIHDSTASPPISDNPMDPNWGGTEYTKGAVDSGKYIENNVYPVTYSMPGGVQFYPGLYQTYPDPPNFVKTVGGTTPPFLPAKPT